ncbi:MAG: DUF4358 domain-containing protein [Oscillospiraceae bacterium]|nr:DUF4358 domain-containing protein [Oscillospiraceae bacterium]
MRTKSILPLALILLLLLGSCAPGDPADTGAVWSADALAQVVLESCALSPDALEKLEGEDQTLYLTALYGLPEGTWEDCAIYRAGGVSATEIAVIILEDEDNVQEALGGLEEYLTAREGDFTGYAPEQAALVAQSAAVRHGRYLALLICEDPEAAQTAFSRCLDGSVVPPTGSPAPAVSAAPTPEARIHPVSSAVPTPAPANTDVPVVTYPGRRAYRQPNLDDMTLYDTTAILSAWAGGDPSALSELDQSILSLAAQVLDEIVHAGMTDYEKERAIYQWLTDHVVYDYDHYDPLAELDPNSFNPYGPLHNGKGVCLGFATTFQLLMDMAGVECITVVGATFNSREDHAWNMVRLDDTWYCTDATWDKGSPPEAWRYFNVTSDRMAKTDHQWDYSQIPEATAANGDIQE